MLELTKMIEELNQKHKTHAYIKIGTYPMICITHTGIDDKLAIYKNGDFVKIGLVKSDEILHTFNNFEASQKAKKHFNCTDDFQIEATRILDLIN